MMAKLDGHSWTVEFPVYIDCTYQNGRYDDHGVARHGYAADAPFIDSLTTRRSIPLRETLRYRGELPTFRKVLRRPRHRIRSSGCCTLW